MNKTELLALAEQIEAADGPSRRLFTKVHEAVLGGPEWDYERQARFLKYCEAEAWTDAALTLVPVEYRDSWCFAAEGPRTYGKPVAHLGFSWWGDGDSDFVGCAATPALALCAAALRAKAGAQ